MVHLCDMPKVGICFIAICLFFTKSVVAQEANYFQISGQFNGVDTGILKMYDRSLNVVIDSSIIVNYQFVLNGKLPELGEYIFNIQPGNWNAISLVEPGNSYLRLDSSLSMQMGKQGNGPKMIPFSYATGTPILNSISQLEHDENIGTLLTELIYLKHNIPNSSDIKTRIDSVQTTLQSNVYNWIKNYIYSNPQNISNAYLIYFSNKRLSVNYPLDDYANLVNAIRQDGRKNPYFKLISDDLKSRQQSSLGQKIIDFSTTDNAGDSFILSRVQSKYILLDFWASWCAPCRASIPALKKLYAKYHSHGLEIVSVTNDRDKNDWLTAIAKEKMPWPQVWDFDLKEKIFPISKLYAHETIPFMVIMDNTAQKILLNSGDAVIIQNKIQELFQ